MSRSSKVAKAGVLMFIGGVLGYFFAATCKFVAIGMLSTAGLSVGAAAAPVLVTIGVVGGLAAYGAKEACTASMRQVVISITIPGVVAA